MAIISDKAMQARPGQRDTWLNEDGARGAGRLIGRITPAGAKLFYYRYTASGGDRVRLLIGHYDARGDGGATFTVQQARDKARELSGLYRSGIKDLRDHFVQAGVDRQRADDDERKAGELASAALQRRLTVRQVFDKWRATELQPQLRADGKRSGRKDGGQYVFKQFERHVFPALGETPIEDVRKANLLALIDAQKAKGQLRTASVLLGDLRQLLSYAVDREFITIDPLASVKKARIVGAPVERDRVLSEAEIRLLSAALPSARMNTRSECAIRLLLATGARVGEIMGATWSDAVPSDHKAVQARAGGLQAVADEEGVKVGFVDLHAKTWHMPTTKNERAHTIHLSDFAIAQFTVLHGLREPLSAEGGKLSPWVFPARDTSRPVCIKSFGKQLADRQRDADQRLSGRSKATSSLVLPGGRWTAHDLRRTAGTLMASLGISGDVIDECLNHMIESRVRRIYIRDRREADQVRAFDALGARLADLLGGDDAGSNVVSIRSAAA